MYVSVSGAFFIQTELRHTLNFKTNKNHKKKTKNVFKNATIEILMYVCKSVFTYVFGISTKANPNIPKSLSLSVVGALVTYLPPFIQLQYVLCTLPMPLLYMPLYYIYNHYACSFM